MPLRPDAQRVHVYNEGFHVYLRDPAHDDFILTQNPASVLDMAPLEPDKDKALRAVSEAGALVIYELEQDDEILIEIGVGPPLSKKELKQSGVTWGKTAQSFLSAPSGRVCIDSANTLRLLKKAQDHAKAYAAKHAAPPEPGDARAFGQYDTGAVVTIPPGDYVLTLHRVDFDSLDEDDEWDGPSEFISLTPLADAAKPKKWKPILPARVGRPTYSGLRFARVEDGAFVGRAVAANIVNMTERHAAALGIRRGQRLVVENEGARRDMVFLGGACPVNGKDVFDLVYPDGLAALAADEPDVMIGAMAADSITGLTLLRVYNVKRDMSPQFKAQSDVRLIPTDACTHSEPPAVTPALDGTYSNGVISGLVIAANESTIALGVGKAHLNAFKAGRVTEISIAIGDWQTRALYLAPGELDYRPYHIVNAGSRDRNDLIKSIRQYMHGGGDAMFRIILGEDRARAIGQILAELESKSTLDPEKGLLPNDGAEGERLCNAYYDLWIGGLERWQPREVATAMTGAHWDAPDRQILLVKPIHHPAHFTCAAKPDDAFTLTHAAP